MARTDPQVNLRMPAKLKAELDAAADANKRSLTAEIVARLQDKSDEAKLLDAALSMAEKSAERERQSIEVMRWMRDQMRVQRKIIEEIAQSGDELDPEFLRAIRAAVFSPPEDNGFPLSEEDIRDISASTDKKVLEEIAARRGFERHKSTTEPAKSTGPTKRKRALKLD